MRDALPSPSSEAPQEIPTASSACPICGRGVPHSHSREEIAEAKRPDGSWRRKRPMHPYEAGAMENVHISMTSPAFQRRLALNRETMRAYEAEMEDWRRNG